MSLRYGIFVHAPDGDMGDGKIVGAFQAPGTADRKAEAIVRAGERQGLYVEAIVLPLSEGSTSARSIAKGVGA